MNQNLNKTGGIMLKPYSLTELANLYKVDRRTIKNWLQPFLEELGEKRGRFYTITQVKIIFKKLSLPSFIENEDEC
jgi:transcription initiation factor TFIIIB Brf1 subunit/transcription initiation factor TFIIB